MHASGSVTILLDFLVPAEDYPAGQQGSQTKHSFYYLNLSEGTSVSWTSTLTRHLSKKKDRLCY